MRNQVMKDLGYQRHLRNTPTYVKDDLKNQISCSEKTFFEVKQNLLNYFQIIFKMMDMIFETVKAMFTL